MGDDDDDEWTENDENKEEEDEEKEIVVLTKEDKLKIKIKKLKTELSETKKTLKFTQFRHCEAVRKRHALQELQDCHKQERDKLHNVIVRKNQQLKQCSDVIISLKAEFIEQRRFFKMFKQQLIDSRNLMKNLEENERENYANSLQDSFSDDLLSKSFHRSDHRTSGYQTKRNRDKLKDDIKGKESDQLTLRVHLDRLQLDCRNSLRSRLSQRLSQESSNGD